MDGWMDESVDRWTASRLASLLLLLRALLFCCVCAYGDKWRSGDSTRRALYVSVALSLKMCRCVW